jgi:hypothetical protein
VKPPAFQFYTGDWLKDPKLSMCLPATRGIWIDAIAAMHENCRSGTLSGTPGQLSRVLRCTESAFMAAIMDLQATGAADVTERNGIVTLINRRMYRESKERESNRLRQSRLRGSQSREPPVAKMSRSLSSSSSSNTSPSGKTPNPLTGFRDGAGGAENDQLFNRFYAAYPRHEAPRQARKAWNKLQPDANLLSVMIAWLGQATKSEQWQDKSKIPHPATWLNQRRWEGDPPPPPIVKRDVPEVERLFGSKTG